MSRRPNHRASHACALAAAGLIGTGLLATGLIATGLITVFSVAAPTAAAAAEPATAEDIRDIRGPKGMLPPWLIPALLAGGALLAIAGYAAWRWKRRQRIPRALLPFEIALQRLEAIRSLMDPSSVREFSIAISDIVRAYIEASFEVTATHLTTEEFLHNLLESSNTSLAAHRNLLAEFLRQCDVAKFAGVSLSRRIMESLHQSACSFVVETSKPAATADPAESSQRAQTAERAETSDLPGAAKPAAAKETLAAPRWTRSGGS
jgi:Domain of unknown function (DUF4381)